MQQLIKNDLRITSALLPDSRGQRPLSDHEALPGKKTHLRSVKPIALPDDVVTLSDSSKPGTKQSPSGKKSSLPVTTAEKQALLAPVHSNYNFSVYG